MIVIQPDIIDKIEVVFDKAIVPAIVGSSKGDSFPLAFVLIVCAIGYLASFNYGDDTTGHAREAYTDFLREYEWFTEKYVPEDVYISLRCGLVHNFTIKGGRYVLVSREPENHLKTRQFLGETMICLNLENFLEDFIRLKNEYFAKVRQSIENKSQNFLKRFSNVGILLPVG